MKLQLLLDRRGVTKNYGRVIKLQNIPVKDSRDKTKHYFHVFIIDL